MNSQPYDPLKDFAPITVTGDTPIILVVNPGLPVRSVAELIAQAKRNPGKLNAGSPGIGTNSHLALELFNRAAGGSISHVPYKDGVGQTLIDLASGQTDLAFTDYPTIGPHLKSGRLSALAVTGRKRVDGVEKPPDDGPVLTLDTRLRKVRSRSWSANKNSRHTGGKRLIARSMGQYCGATWSFIFGVPGVVCLDIPCFAFSGYGESCTSVALPPIWAFTADHDLALGDHSFVGAELDVEFRFAEQWIDHAIGPYRARCVAVLSGACGPAKQLPDLGCAHADRDDVFSACCNHEALIGLSCGRHQNETGQQPAAEARIVFRVQGVLREWAC